RLIRRRQRRLVRNRARRDRPALRAALRRRLARAARTGPLDVELILPRRFPAPERPGAGDRYCPLPLIGRPAAASCRAPRARGCGSATRTRSRPFAGWWAP